MAITPMKYGNANAVPRNWTNGEWLIGVAGESFENADGSSRQEIISRCSEDETALLVREPENQYDRKAIKVCRLNGEQIGYIPREWNRMAGQIDNRGLKFKAAIFRINRPRNRRFAGVVIRVGLAAQDSVQS